MKHLKMLGHATLLALAITTSAAGSASATTLEINGVTQNSSVTFSASLASGSSFQIVTTPGSTVIDTCTSASWHGATVTPFTAHSVTAPLSSASITSCINGDVTVNNPGSFVFTRTTGTNGTMWSAGAEWKVPSPFGTLTCKTGEGTDIGTLTGVKEGNATIHVNGVLNCGIVPSARLIGSIVFTSPTGLGVEA